MLKTKADKTNNFFFHFCDRNLTIKTNSEKTYLLITGGERGSANAHTSIMSQLAFLLIQSKLSMILH